MYLIEAFPFIANHEFRILFQNPPIRNRKRLLLNQIANLNINFVRSIATQVKIQACTSNKNRLVIAMPCYAY